MMKGNVFILLIAVLCAFSNTAFSTPESKRGVDFPFLLEITALVGEEKQQNWINKLKTQEEVDSAITGLENLREDLIYSGYLDRVNAVYQVLHQGLITHRAEVPSQAEVAVASSSSASTSQDISDNEEENTDDAVINLLENIIISPPTVNVNDTDADDIDDVKWIYEHLEGDGASVQYPLMIRVGIKVRSAYNRLLGSSSSK